MIHENDSTSVTLIHPPNISRKGCRQIFGGSTAPKYFTERVPSNIWGVYSPKCFTDGVPSNIWGVYSPQIFDGSPSVKYLGALHPPNI